MTALGRSDYATIVDLFAPDGRVRSPFLGEMDAAAFFDRLAEASSENVITPLGVLLSPDESMASAYFRYEWTVRDGAQITFEVMDLFHFRPESDEVTFLDIIYDTHPIRVEHGNKYED